MRTNESAEMYLETILLLREKMSGVRSIDVARETGYSKPSVSRAMGLLRARKLIEIDELGIITLTDEGCALASKILDRHRSLTRFLMRVGVPEEIATEDACRIEHVISDESMDCIKRACLDPEDDK
ncbi:MAG: metal-dependent transcriptional regulator [Clostridia bacterium]|nr:metal-dependent transcriptional regulator [Clostridia bacterium]